MKIGTCNRFSRVWAAIYGCEGTGPLLRTQRAAMGHYVEKIYACATCRACEATSNVGFELNRVRLDTGMRALYAAHDIHQEFLSQCEALAGVENYRWERTARDRKTKRPYLLRHGEPLAPMLERWHMLTPIPAHMLPGGR